jgi:hypothetical protein
MMKRKDKSGIFNDVNKGLDELLREKENLSNFLEIELSKWTTIKLSSLRCVANLLPLSFCIA